DAARRRKERHRERRSRQRGRHPRLLDPRSGVGGRRGHLAEGPPALPLSGRVIDRGPGVRRRPGDIARVSDLGVFAVLHSLRAIREFEPDPIPDDAIATVRYAGTRAPSPHNSQPWAYIVLRVPASWA